MKYADRAKTIFAEEISELSKLQDSLDDHFDKVVDLMYACRGKIVVMGIGKTGIIGHKIASSLASTGTPAIFVNAAEAVHGDLGMIAKDDVILLVSNSGSTDEILNVVNPVRSLGSTIVALTGDPSSRLAQACDYVLPIHVDKEACPLGLAPTTSTTATTLMGDALVVCLMEKRQFKAENFALYHPGGALGRQLLARVQNRMATPIPMVQVNAGFRDVVREMSAHHLGTTMVFDGTDCVGIITDGDVRRAIEKYDDLHITAAEIMTPSYKHIHKSALLTDALAIMDMYNITTLAVTETPESKEIIGIISIHHIIDFK